MHEDNLILNKKRLKRPESVLVVICTERGQVLLMRRNQPDDFWQSVTGSMHWEEIDPMETARREVTEETGIADTTAIVDLQQTRRFYILPQWRDRFAEDVTENVEHAFLLRLAQKPAIKLDPTEHTEYVWLPKDRALERASSSTNRAVIRECS